MLHFVSTSAIVCVYYVRVHIAVLLHIYTIMRFEAAFGVKNIAPILRDV